MANLDVIQQLKKAYGENVITKASQLPEWKVLPTGIPELDLQLGGGIHVGHWNFICGNKNVGKTTLAYEIVSEFQKFDINCYFIDLDRFFSAERAKLFGVDTDKLIVITEGLTTETVQEMGVAIINAHRNSKDDKRALIVLDSFAALASEGTYEKAESVKNTKGYGTDDAKANNTLLKVWNGLGTSNITFLIIQQFRDGFGYGEDNMLTRGRGQEFYASNILEIRAGKTLKESTMPVGQEFRWTVRKTKNASPKQTGETLFYYEKGFDNSECLLRTAISMGIIEQAGAYYTVGSERIRGKESLFETLKENKEMMDSLHKQVYAKMGTEIWDGSEISLKAENETETS